MTSTAHTVARLARTRNKLVVCVVGVEGEQPFAHVHQALCNPDQEQHGGLLVVVAAQASQQLS